MPSDLYAACWHTPAPLASAWVPSWATSQPHWVLMRTTTRKGLSHEQVAQFSLEIRERAVRMVQEQRGEYAVGCYSVHRAQHWLRATDVHSMNGSSARGSVPGFVKA
ncbi:hypothetical protein SAMN05216359_103186 [Roseateles sp. YR242]|nr:hypothetical protein SAMN05216359_103186 [Roseateles sp. YR242]